MDKNDFYFKGVVEQNEMDHLLDDVQTRFNLFVTTFLNETAKTHRIPIDKLLAAWSQYCKSTSNPHVVASKIAAVTTDDSESSEGDEVKTRVDGDDSEGDEPKAAIVVSNDDDESSQPPVKGNVVVESEDDEASASGSDEPAPVVKGKGKPAAKPAAAKPAAKGKPAAAATQTKVKPAAKGAAKGKPAAKGAAKVKPAPVEDDSDSEAEESAAASDAADASDAESEPKAKQPAKKGARSETKVKPAADDGEMTLSDAPKLAVKDRPAKMPKGVQFLKGTNFVVRDNTVVANLTKKGIIKLSAANIKSLDAKGTTHDAWDDAKIKKTFK